MVIFSESAEGLQKGFDVLADYCNRWKVKVNTNKTKVVIFRKGGILPRNLKLTFEGKDIQIVRSFFIFRNSSHPRCSLYGGTKDLSRSSSKSNF